MNRVFNSLRQQCKWCITEVDQKICSERCQQTWKIFAGRDDGKTLPLGIYNGTFQTAVQVAVENPRFLPGGTIRSEDGRFVARS